MSNDFDALLRSMFTDPPRNRQAMNLPVNSPAQAIDPPCVFREESAGTVPCVCTTGKIRNVQGYRCSLKGVCTVNERWLPVSTSVTVCRLCKEREAEDPNRRLVWQVGITTVLKRKTDLLPQTLTGLARAGWENPRLFVDGGTYDDWKGVTFPISVRDKTHALANWWLGMQELYVRNPLADRYMMVEDDVLFTPNAREYLDRVRWPGAGYLNLYTTPANRQASGDRKGFFKVPNANMGLGALALVFDRDSVVKILSSPYFIEAFRPFDFNSMTTKPNTHRARMHQDGHVAKAAKRVGISEYCHFPSIVQHLGGKASTLHHNANPDSDCFDPNFDLRTIL